MLMLPSIGHEDRGHK